MSVSPVTAATSASSARTPWRSQSGWAMVSSSVNAMISALAPRQPRLRAPAGPRVPDTGRYRKAGMPPHARRSPSTWRRVAALAASSHTSTS